MNLNSFSYFQGSVYKQGTLDSGDTAWMLAATALVFFMTIPGLGVYYSGAVRDKSVIACEYWQCILKMSNQMTIITYRVITFEICT